MVKRLIKDLAAFLRELFHAQLAFGFGARGLPQALPQTGVPQEHCQFVRQRIRVARRNKQTIDPIVQ